MTNAAHRNRPRLSWTNDKDHVWGPFLYARESRRAGNFALVACSGDGEEYRGASLRLTAFTHTLIMALPQWLLRPARQKVKPDWDEATVARLGRDYYWDYTRREYGFSIHRDGGIGSAAHWSISFGRQSHSSRTEQRIGGFLPWTQWRYMRTSYYTPDGVHLRTFPAAARRKRRTRSDGSSGIGGVEDAFSTWEQEYAYRSTIPTMSFAFLDFDGEAITATTRVEEREWRRGEGLFRWLSWFVKPMITRSLDLDFSRETGKRKGSWKGGTLGHGTDMQPGDTPESAFRRYCDAHNMTFMGALPEPEETEEVA